MQTYAQLEAIFRKVLTLESVASLLTWDTQVMMPAQSYRLRALQFAALDGVIHELMSCDKTALLVNQANAQKQNLSPLLQRNLALMTKKHQRNNALPLSLIEKYETAVRISEHAWLDAKKNKRFDLFAPELDKLLTLVKEKANILSQCWGISPFEALMDEYDPNRKQAEVDAWFAPLKSLFPDVIAASCIDQKQAALLNGIFPKSKQLKLCKAILKSFSFSLDNGRLDESIHPFTSGDPDDVRMTTCFDKTNPLNTILGLMHELGHGIYDKSLPHDYRLTLVGQDAGMAIHEGLALFLEKCLGTSLPFVDWLSTVAPTYLGDSSAWQSDNLYALLTQIDPQKPRIESDELCYMAHILIRYETEKALFGNEITVQDIPAFWQSQSGMFLGVQVEEADCLQDIHWAQGYFGYFQTYGIGLLFAAQLHYFIAQHHPELYHHVASGNMTPLIAFLKHSICQHGALYSASELIQKATHQPLKSDALIHYLKSKYLKLS